MTGHALLNCVKEKKETICVDGSLYNIHVSYHSVAGLKGYIAGLKFSDRFDSMDSSKVGKVNPFLLGSAIARKTIQMITPDLGQISIFGFYLLTDDIESRKKGGSRLKKRLYQAQAIEIHSKVKHRLPHMTRVEAAGGLGWAMGREDFAHQNNFKVFERELAKQLRVIPC